ncbi:MAG: HD domain-containing protein [Chloroflexota bacterium]|nr:HD domain-containing protein [Chloroflexota bacterium]
MTDVSDRIDLLRHLLKLKTTPRTGWLDRGVPSGETESIADHILMTALIGWITADDGLDRDRVLKLALVHDLAEAITGDPPPYNRSDVPPAEDIQAIRDFFSRRHVRNSEDKAAKDQRERTVMTELTNLMPDHVASEIADLWNEYEEQTSPEARFAKDLDRFEAFLQARAYQSRFPDLPLGGFTHMALDELEHPTLITLRDAILADEEPDS